MVRYPTFEAGPVCYVPNPDKPFEMILTVNRCYGNGDYPKTGSVQEYIVGHCEAMLSETLCAQICNGLLKPGKGTYKVPQPDRATASSAYITKVYFSQESETVVLVEAVFIATLDLYAFLGETTVIDQRDEWFSICGMWDLSDEDNILPDWERFSVYKKKNRPKECALDEYLVPVMDKHTCHLETTRMLRIYCPEALEQSMQLNPRTLAARLGLGIQYLPLADKDAYLATLFCRDSEVKVINKDTGEILPVSVQKNTIILNAQTVGKDERCKAAKAIIHECMHNFSHRLFWLFQRLYSAEIAYFTCPVDVEKTCGCIHDPLRWLGIQADALTRAAQIPADTVQREVESRVARYTMPPAHENRAGIMRLVIHELSEVYVVSKKQMRKRLMELGYEDAVGAYDWVDGRYVPPYCFKEGSLGKDQTYTIDWESLRRLSDENEELRNLLSSGSVIRAEGHLCLNDDKYVSYAATGPILTQYARSHVDECCLKLDVVYHRSAPQYEDGVLHSELTVVDKAFTINTESIEEIVNLKKKVLADKRRIQRIISALPIDGAGTLVAHMKRIDILVEKLAELVHASETSIKKWRKDDVNVPPLRTAIAICIALHLEPDLSSNYLRKLGISFRLTEEHHILRYVLEKMYLSSVEACNEFLLAAGNKPLLKDETPKTA